MIFAEMEYQRDYWDFHAELLAFIGAHFSQLKSGLQGDSRIWIFDGEEKVAIDTFSSTKHQIKSPKAGLHVQKVIETLLLKYFRLTLPSSGRRPASRAPPLMSNVRRSGGTTPPIS